jgi:hypothetical protein
MRPRDTSPEAWTVYLDLQRKLSPSAKLRQAFEWSEVVRQFSIAGLRQRYPQADEREIFLRAARMNLGPELFRKAYGDKLPEDSDAHGA